MAELLLLVIGLVVLTHLVEPGWIIGTIMSVIDWAFFKIAWWQLVLLVVLVVLCTQYIAYLIKKAKKKK